MKRYLLASAAAICAALPHGAALAVTDGELDGNRHPYVGLLVFESDVIVNGQPLRWRCSGTLISPTRMLTAGHCTSGTIGGRVWFASDVDAGRPGNGYPVGGTSDSYEFCGRATHQEFTDAAFFLHDVGIVELCAAVPPEVYGSQTLPELPTVNQLDGLKTQRGHKDLTFTAVGYGLQKSFPDAAAWKDQAFRVRMLATPHLIQINTGFTGDFSLLLSNNAATGGTCYGDSGGPNFVGTSKVIGGVTSYGLNAACGGTGGVFRVDRQNVQDFITSPTIVPY